MEVWSLLGADPKPPILWAQESVRSTGQRVSRSPLWSSICVLEEDRLNPYGALPLAVGLGVVRQVPCKASGCVRGGPA